MAALPGRLQVQGHEGSEDVQLKIDAVVLVASIAVEAVPRNIRQRLDADSSICPEVHLHDGVVFCAGRKQTQE